MTTQEVDERIDMKLGIFMEHLDHKLVQLLEAMGEMIERHVKPIIREELVKVKQDTSTIKFVVKETNHDFQDLKRRITQVEKIISEKP